MSTTDYEKGRKVGYQEGWAACAAAMAAKRRRALLRFKITKVEAKKK